MSNQLKNETSPYLLQHANNPVNWYPWCRKAFEKAKAEDKPIFLSIGYSTCHWCHVMAHESFEDEEIADILNKNFVCIKVDREERPDIDSIYMTVCQAFTGSGGWPTSIFMNADQKPFFAGTYFPKASRYGMIGLGELLYTIIDKWKSDREKLICSADDIVRALNQSGSVSSQTDSNLIDTALDLYRESFDSRFGGFGNAPKFPSPHNLIFLINCYKKYGDTNALKMAETTLLQMYSGGIFDHIGYGFSRYSTDRYFLVPHFEKMLYDNALLILAYCTAYDATKKPFYSDVAEKTAFYIMHEMTSPDGAFFSAQDADSEGEEGKYYLFLPEEITDVIGEKDGDEFNRYYNITSNGNFEGKNIPNLLQATSLTDKFERFLPQLRDFRRNRYRLHTDDKILCSWNSLMIAALCSLYRVSCKTDYLDASIKAKDFIEKNLCENDDLYVSYRDGKRGSYGFLDDYAAYIYALLALYDATIDNSYLDRANTLLNKVITEFYDDQNGGFFLYGTGHEALILRPKESYDSAIPSGNSMMTYNLVRLNYLKVKSTEAVLKKQLDFMSAEAKGYPAGYAMFLSALSDYLNPPQMIKVFLQNSEDIKDLPLIIELNSIVTVLSEPTNDYPLINEKTTFYICRNNSCLPPTNDIKLLETDTEIKYSTTN